MGEVVIWQMFWHFLPWDFRTVMVKVSKHASSEITLAASPTVTHSWAVHSEQGFLPLPDTKSYPPYGATKQLGYEIYIKNSLPSKHLWAEGATTWLPSSPFMTKPRGSLNESISIVNVWGNNPGAGTFCLPSSCTFPLHREIPYFSNRITQPFLRNFKPKQIPHLENKNKRVKTY